MELFNSVLCIWCLDPAYAVCGQILRELFVDLSFISREGCQQGKSIHYSKLSFLSSVRHFSLVITSLLRHIKSLRLDTQYFDIFFNEIDTLSFVLLRIGSPWENSLHGSKLRRRINWKCTATQQIVCDMFWVAFENGKKLIYFLPFQFFASLIFFLLV